MKKTKERKPNMSNKHGHGEHLEVILREMCSRVKADYETMEFKKDTTWYNKYSWSQEEQHGFGEWMINYLYNNTSARKEIMHWPKKTFKACRKVSDWFLFQHGWSYKKETS